MGSFTRPFNAKGTANEAERRETQAGRGAIEAGANLSDIARQLFNMTGGLRTSTLGILEKVLAGEHPEAMRVFAPEREAVESQFRRARENVIATTPARGGQLNRLLADTEVARAQTLGGLEADVRRSAFQQALGVGFGAPPVTIAGLGAAGSVFGTGGGVFGQQATRAVQEYQAKNESIGKLAGMAAGAGFV